MSVDIVYRTVVDLTRDGGWVAPDNVAQLSGLPMDAVDAALRALLLAGRIVARDPLISQGKADYGAIIDIGDVRPA